MLGNQRSMTTKAAGAISAKGSGGQVRRTTHDHNAQPTPWARASAKVARIAMAGDQPEKRVISPGIQAAQPRNVAIPAISPARLITQNKLTLGRPIVW
jgi:hypothetical protein